MAHNPPSRPETLSSEHQFAIVASQYNPAFVHGLVDNARNELAAIAPGSTVSVWEVPGAFEIPLIVQELALSAKFSAIIALGVIIEGATQHAALIGATLTDSLQRLSLAHGLPIVHEVLLVKNEAQAQARCLESTLNRGIEAARVAVQMVQVMSTLPGH